jgi:YkoY family integral membrane protein
VDIDLVQAGGIIATLVLLEAVLSFDNAAILAVMSRKLPAGAQRRRALNYGLGIAYVLRIVAILVAVVLVRNTLFLTIGGAYLLFLFLKHFLGLARGKPAHPTAAAPKKAAMKGFLGLSPLHSVILQIGLVDVAFALDQVVAAVAFTKDVAQGDLLRVGVVHLTYQQTLIIAAATAGLISLRLLAPFISRLMDWLPLLEHMAFVAVGFVGALLVLEHPQVLPSPTVLTHALEPIKIPLTLGLFAVPILTKLLFKVPRSHGHPHAQMERAIEAAQPLQPEPKKP